MSRSRRIFFLFALTGLLAACGGGGGDTGTGPEGGDQAPPTLSAATSAPLAALDLGGLPTDRSDLVAEIRLPDTAPKRVGESWLLPLLPLGEGSYRLFPPLHPVNPSAGGRVEVRVLGDNGFITEPATFEITALPEAPGAFAVLLDSMQALLDVRFARLGTTREAVLGANWSQGIPDALLSVAVAQTVIDDPSHERDLRGLLAGSAPYQQLLGATTLDLDLLDRVAAASGLTADLAASLRRERVRRVRDISREKRLSIGSAAELDAAMEEARDAANEVDPNSATGGLLQDYGLGLGGIGLIGGPATATVAAGMGFALWAYQTYLEGKANLLPSEFVPGSLGFDVDVAVFEEDRDGPGEWSNARISAQSKGWKLDKTIADLLLQLAGGRDAYSGWINRVGAEAASFVRSLGSFIAGTQLGNLPIADSGFVEVAPEVWSNIDITGSPWSEARVVGGDAIALVTDTHYDPRRAGDALLTVSPNSSRFGGATPIDARETIRVDAIDVTIQATTTRVDPGETVELQVMVESAVDPSLEWSLSPGASWSFGPQDIGGGVWSAVVQTPSDPALFPVQVLFRSTATGGARSQPGAPVRQDIVNLTTSEVEVFVDPGSDCLQPGESRTFVAIVTGADDTSVTWSATGPGGTPSNAVNSSGVFTAPSAVGEYLVIATSVEDPTAQAAATVEVGGCACSWSLTISGSPGGSWSGTFAAHSFPNDPIPGPFNMSLTPDGGNAPGGSGNVTVVDATSPSAGSTGSYLVSFSFGDGSSRVWVATNTEGTDATMTITENDGTTIVGSISGTTLTLVNGEAVYGSFELQFRSNNFFGDTVCGE